MKDLAAKPADHDEMAMLANLLKAATADYIVSADDIPEAISKLASAAATFAGAQFGSLIVMGVMTDQDQRRIVDTMARNVREGIKVGKAMATRVAAESAQGRA